MTRGRPHRPLLRPFSARASVLCLVLPLALLLTTSGVPSKGVTPRLRIATWNMCGVDQWGCENTGTHRRKAEALVELASVDGASVIMLQEVCTGDLVLARQRLGEGWHSAFQAYTYRDAHGRHAPVRCTGGGSGDAGIAVLSSSPLKDVAPLPSRQPAVGLQRGIQCGSLPVHRIRICNAHLSVVGSDRAHPGWEYRDDQLRTLVAAADSRTVFGGDFNSSPPSRADAYRWIWPHEAYRRYRECDQRSAGSRAGRATHRSGVKLDYQFTRLRRAGCAVRETGVSDHLAVVMTVRTDREDSG
ncbi:endonuclease/exonuclease/phosphatase family protein [Streptomyces halstedii]|uniref:endonuclease/exonuclease/phosphatase family protein n=1 Tax=Streptomyces halstedii TaxID=1944 RepID=UPI0032455C3D